MIRDYKQLKVWQKAMDLVVEVYKLTDKYPKEEIYGLISQTRRSAVSVVSNIAEGKTRGSDNKLKRFLLIAFGSGGELETQIGVAKRLEKTKDLNYSTVDNLLNEVMKMLNTLIVKLSARC
jgi:four helix bundle protein